MLDQNRWKRSGLNQLVTGEELFFATGIEDTFVSEPQQSTGRVLDEYSLTEHYDRWKEDIDAMSQLSVPAARYGIPWYKVSPEQGKWDWDFADKALDRLLELGIQPIVDLVHYGTPSWMDQGFLHPDYPNFVAEYASKVAERFKGRVYWYTPLNEPRIAAYYCGKLGFWPPHAKGWNGFLRVLTNISKGIVLTSHALEAADPEIVKCHVDATDLYESMSPESERVVLQRQEIVFLALDLLMGKFNHESPLFEWTRANGLSETDIEWFQTKNCQPDVLGINLYPMFSLKQVFKTGGRTRFKMPYARNRKITERLGQMYWDRYGVPLIVSETAANGSVAKRRRWLQESLADVERLRSTGVPLIGYTWWPMFSLIAWSYLRATSSIERHIVHMGLWDLDPDLNRVETPLVKEFAALSGSSGRNRDLGGDAYLS